MSEETVYPEKIYLVPNAGEFGDMAFEEFAPKGVPSKLFVRGDASTLALHAIELLMDSDPPPGTAEAALFDGICNAVEAYEKIKCPELSSCESPSIGEIE